MPLPGTRFGPYQITGQLGAGGMGEVFRAVDTKLGREVAIKTLPSSLAADPDRIARFEREAKLLATLSHAHIGAIYGLDEQAGTRFLAMELIEGETLATRLERGALPVEDALRLALQIAEALEAAHGKGVVHRDLKPANVMITGHGQVKVVDFGLAKAFSGSPSEASPVHSPALSIAMTQAGLILGSAGYMSPEQASGQATDQQADIWSFGVVLYEMLTGLPVFAGESVPHILADVLRAEPDWSRLPKNLHPRIRLLLERCLAKRVRDRYHSIADARVDIEQTLRDPRGATPAPIEAGGVPLRRLALPLAAALLVGAALAVTYLSVLEPEPPPPAATQRLSITMPPNRPLVIRSRPDRALTLSPDGRELVYVSLDPAGLADQSRSSPLQLALRQLDSLAVVDLRGSIGARQLFFSHDGKWLGFFTEARELKKVSLAGGAAITLAQNINGGEWGFGVWLPDDTIVFGSYGAALRRVSAEGGAVTDVTTLDISAGELYHSYPASVPNSDAVLFTNFTTGQSRIEALMLESGERRAVVANARVPLVLESGHLLFQRDEAILIAPFDTSALAVTGPAVPLIDAVQHDSATIDSVAQLAVSRNGTLAYLPAIPTMNRLGFSSRDGTFTALDLPPGDYSLPRLSRDGRALAFIESRGQQRGAWVYDLERGTTSKLGADGDDLGLAWHPDGRSLAVAHRNADEKVGIVQRGLDGSERVLVPPSPGIDLMRNLSWSPDGMQLAYTVQTGSLHDIWIYSMAEQMSAPFLAAAASEYSPSFSPDGRWLAYESDESGELQVYVQAFPQGERFRISIDRGRGPVWSPDGSELFFTGGADNETTLLAVSVTPNGQTLDFGRPAAVFTYRSMGATGELVGYAASSNVGPGFDVAPDGAHFAVVATAGSELRREVVLVQGWFEELKRIAPTQP